MKRCLRCGEVKPLDAFPPRVNRGKQTVRPYCRTCYTVYWREYYSKDKKGHQQRAKRRTATVRALVRAAKDRPCADCGQCFPFYVMQFDHREGEERLFCIGRMSNYRTVSKARLVAEIAKCDVVCANCHSERTYQRKQRKIKKAGSLSVTVSDPCDAGAKQI